MLIFADLFSAGITAITLSGIIWCGCCLRHWRIAAGYLLMLKISDRQLAPVIGCIVLAMLALKARTMRSQNGPEERPIQAGRWFGRLMGFAAGVTTMMANAAGPVMVLYLLAMGMENADLWARPPGFFIINWTKVPFSVLWV